MKLDPTAKSHFTLTIDVLSDRDADETVILFQKFFLYYHPSLKAVVRKQVIDRTPVENDEKEDLL